MRYFALFFISLFLVGCVDPKQKHLKRLENIETIEICHDGVMYIQFVSGVVNLGVSVKRERDGRVELCGDSYIVNDAANDDEPM